MFATPSSRLFTIAMIGVLTIGIALSSQEAVADDTHICTGGVAGHIATKTEADAATDGSITAGVSYLCPKDAQLGISASVGAAKEFLTAHACAQTIRTGRAPKCPNATRELHIDGLASKFAIYAADFIRKFEAQGGGTICVRDAYREPGEQQCAANNSANGNAVAKPGHSKHEIGEAVDLNPRGGATYTTMRSFADQNEKCTWFRYQCNQDTSPGNSTKDSLNDCPHLELKSSCDAGTLPTANANPSRYTSSPGRSFSGPQSGITTTPGVGASASGQATPGQALNQDYECVLGLDPPSSIIIPAGTPIPSGCLNNAQQTQASQTQAFCAGNTIVYNTSGNNTIGQMCPYGCQNGTCIQQRQQNPQQQGSGLQGQGGSSGGSGTQSSSPSSPSSPASSAGTQTSAQTNTGTDNPFATTITTPTLVPRLLSPSSTIDILNSLANAEIPVVSHATNTPIKLNTDAHNILQLHATLPPSVTYARPASSFFTPPSTGQTTTEGTNNGSNNRDITTTAGTGYDTNNTVNPTPTSSTAIQTRPVSGADTFTSNDLSPIGTSDSYQSAPSTFANGTLSLLAIVKTQILGALHFLAVYGHPFGGTTSTQAGGE